LLAQPGTYDAIADLCGHSGSLLLFFLLVNLHDRPTQRGHHTLVRGNVEGLVELS
jgi:hypothetical protein